MVVGQGYSVNHTGTLSSFVAYSTMPSIQTDLINQVLATSTGETTTIVQGGASRVESASADMFLYTGVDIADADQIIVIEGLMVVTVAGNIELYFKSSSATDTSVMQNSCLILTKVA